MTDLTLSCDDEEAATPPSGGGGGDDSRLVIADKAAPTWQDAAGGKCKEALDGTVSLDAIYSPMGLDCAAVA